MRKDFGYRLYKRASDLFLAILLLIIFSPVMFFAAIAIKLDSPGPVLADIPKRVGRWNRLFRLFKFRSMICNAHTLLRTEARFKALYQEYKKDSYKLKEDPRITRVGKVIRKYSIDEMPQLFNVIKGDMSLIGPRPYYSDELKQQQKEYPHTRQYVKKMLDVKPGITGLWQVSGRSNVNFDERIILDAQYAQKKSVIMDLKILVKTPWAMLTGKGAR
ncbi:MAG: sugar transferase [Candidatus Shapirobacteria bacterium]